MEEFAKAVDLGPIISDRSSIAAMKDSYAFEFFSWPAFIMKIFFMFMIQASRSKTLSIDCVLNLLECAIKQFYYYLDDVNNSTPNNFFTPTFTESSFGTLFGDRNYIIRCINQ